MSSTGKPREKLERVSVVLEPNERETLVLGSHLRQTAKQIAATMTARNHGLAIITRAQVFRRAVVIGLDELAREHAPLLPVDDDGDPKK